MPDAASGGRPQWAIAGSGRFVVEGDFDDRATDAALRHQPLALRISGLAVRLHDREGHIRPVVRVLEEGLADNPAWVVLAGIELFPVDVVEVRTHFLAQALLRAIRHVADTPHQAPELRRVVRDSLRAQQEYRDHEDHEELVDSQAAEHSFRLTLPAANPPLRWAVNEEQNLANKESSWKFAEDFIVERTEIAQARQHSIELGIDAVSPATGAQLAVIAAATAATNIIEIGTGVGVSGLWLLSGAPGATLTSIDFELDYQQSAKKAFLDAGIPANRVRLIAGRAIDVLPRMNEQSYDIVLVDADPHSVIQYVEHGLRLLRTGGTLLVAHALWRGRVADPAQRDDTVAGFRSLLTEIAESPAVISALSPVGDGLLQLTKL